MEDNEEVRTCKEHRYLGMILNREKIDDQEINNIITKAKRIIAYLDGILWSKSITKKREFNIYEAMIRKVLLYSCET